MNVTWRQQIVSYCVLLVARMFADDPTIVQDLKNLSNKITTADSTVPDAPPAPAPVAGSLDQFASGVTRS